MENIQDAAANKKEHICSCSGSPLISVILPVFNRQATIARAIESVLAQTYPYFELLVINDGSTDDTESLCHRYESDGRVKVFTTGNRGASAARNLGLERCSAEYLCFLDSDDELTASALEVMAAPYLKEDAPDLVVTGLDNGRQRIPISGQYTLGIRDFLSCYLDLSWQNLFKSPCGKLYRRELVFGNSLRFDETMSSGEDTCFNFSYYPLCGRVFLSESRTYIIHFDRSEPGHLSDHSSESFSEMMERVKKYDSIYKECFSAVSPDWRAETSVLFLDSMWNVMSDAAVSLDRRSFVKDAEAFDWSGLLPEELPEGSSLGYRVIFNSISKKRWGSMWSFFSFKRVLSGMFSERTKARHRSKVNALLRRSPISPEGDAR